MRSASLVVTRVLFLETFGSILRFPIWWYSNGFESVVHWCLNEAAYFWRSYAIALWLRTFFVPMYGQYDLSGRLVSVFMRFVILIGRITAFVFLCFVGAIFLLMWLIAPLFLILLFVFNLY